MNFGMAGPIGAAPRGRSSRLKASVAEEDEGGGSPPSGEAMSGLERTRTAAANGGRGLAPAQQRSKST